MRVVPWLREHMNTMFDGAQIQRYFLTSTPCTVYHIARRRNRGSATPEISDISRATMLVVHPMASLPPPPEDCLI